MPITTTTIGSGTVETSASGAVTDVTDLQTLIGRPDGSTNLGTFTGLTIADSSTIKTALQSLETAVELQWFNVVNYGASNTGASDTSAAILAAHNAAHAATKFISNTTTGSSINRRYSPAVFFPPGIYRIDAPIVLDDAGQDICWYGPGAVLMKAGSNGLSGSFTGDCCVKIGTYDAASIVTTAYRAYFFGLAFVDFPLAIRDGISPNNFEQAMHRFERCHFIGPDGGTGLGVRIFNRSMTCSFEHCNFDNLRRSIEIQSCDKTVIEDCRFRWEDKIAPANRPKYDASIVIYEGQVSARNSVFIPFATAYDNDTGAKPLAWFMAKDFDAWVANTAYIVGDIARQSGTLYVCVTANSDAAFTLAKWAVVSEAEEGPLSVWTTVDCDGCHFGGEGGGLAALIWDHAPDETSLKHLATVARINNCQLAAGSATHVGASGKTPHILCVQIPNRIEFTNNSLSQYASQCAVDYHAGVTAPTPWQDVFSKTRTVVIHDNQGGGNAARPNWAPANMGPLVPGSGITTGTGTIYGSSVQSDLNIITTRIFIDLTGLESSGAANTVIGNFGTINCHLGQILTNQAGTIIAGRMLILETPAGGDAATDIDLYAATESNLAQNSAIASATETLLCNAGEWTAGQVKTLTTMPANNSYLYLVGVSGPDRDDTYTAGQVMIELIGTL